MSTMRMLRLRRASTALHTAQRAEANLVTALEWAGHDAGAALAAERWGEIARLREEVKLAAREEQVAVAAGGA